MLQYEEIGARMTEEPRFQREKKIAQHCLLIVEGLILFIITIAFWYHIDPNQTLRDGWFWLLWMAVPVFLVRLKLFGYLWTPTPLHNLLIIFILLAAFNFNQALYSRESFLAVMARPLLGMWIYIYLVELTKTTKNLKAVIVITLGMTFCLAILALTASQWLETKTGVLWSMIEILPRFDYRATATAIEGRYCSPLIDMVHSYRCFNPGIMLRNSLLSFNVNEVAGALSWMIPVMAGLAFIPYKDKDSQNFWLITRFIASILFVLLLIALIFGQSRFAILGVFSTLILGVIIFIPSKTWRYATLGLIAVVILIQAGILFNVFTPTSDTGIDTTETAVGLSGRDSNSVATRIAIWQSSLQMMLDRPLSGVGVYMFRTAVSREPYQIEYYVENNIPSPPHAHNEWLNIGAEMGVLGLLVYVSWQLSIIYMVWYGWKNGDKQMKVVALASFGGLLAHAIYGLGDTIALWDRFQFILWWVVGLVGAQYVLAQIQSTENEKML